MADAHFEVYNADGSLQFDITHRLFLNLIEFDTVQGVAGSLQLPYPGAGAIAINQNYSDIAVNPPKITVSGSTVSWPAGSASHVRLLVY